MAKRGNNDGRQNKDFNIDSQAFKSDDDDFDDYDFSNDDDCFINPSPKSFKVILIFIM